MLRLSDIIPRTALHLVALMAIVGVLWSGAGVQWWMASLSEKTHLVSTASQNDGEPVEDHHKKDKHQDTKILIRTEMSERAWSTSLVRPSVEIVLSPLHHPDVLTPPPEC